MSAAPHADGVPMNLATQPERDCGDSPAFLLFKSKAVSEFSMSVTIVTRTRDYSRALNYEILQQYRYNRGLCCCTHKLFPATQYQCNLFTETDSPGNLLAGVDNVLVNRSRGLPNTAFSHNTESDPRMEGITTTVCRCVERHNMLLWLLCFDTRRNPKTHNFSRVETWLEVPQLRPAKSLTTRKATERHERFRYSG